MISLSCYAETANSAEDGGVFLGTVATPRMLEAAYKLCRENGCRLYVTGELNDESISDYMGGREIQQVLKASQSGTVVTSRSIS